MQLDSLNLKLVIILTVGFTFASIFGYLAQRLKLSPILGYLLAGFIIGPFSPGYVADLQLAEQLAEVGVMLMMFGVGMHFKWRDLMNVKNIAIPGALGQTFVAATCATFLVWMMGGNWHVGLLIGLAIGVASTVVLVRVLSDQGLLNTIQGHIAVGWLIVEDILTVAVLILLPTIASIFKGAAISPSEILFSVGLLLVKFGVLAVVMFTLGSKIVSHALFMVARTRSQELFTLGVLALTFLIAVGSAYIFGTSIALGAFIAGMVIGQTDVRHQASATASPMKDVFVVIFFLSVGMLFNPLAILQYPYLFLGILFIVLIIKPLTAFLITLLYGYPKEAALTVALALGQIGEFSFILAQESAKYRLFPDEGFDVIVACALISIALNPILFKWVDMWKENPIQTSGTKAIEAENSFAPFKAIVVGYGLIGQRIVTFLDRVEIQSTIIDSNVDTIRKLTDQKREAVYGDATLPNLLQMAKTQAANLLIITIPEFQSTLSIIKYAQELHPNIQIIARVRYKLDEKKLTHMGIKWVCCEEEEVCQAFNRILLLLTQEREEKKTLNG